MREIWDSFMGTLAASLGESLPILIVATLILLGGWILAGLCASLVRLVFKRSGLDGVVSGWVRKGSDAPDFELGKYVATGVYYLILFVFFIAFFDALKLTQVVSPLNEILSTISAYAPRVISAAIILFIAWQLARLTRALILRSTQPKHEQYAESLGTLGYSIVFIVFLPAVLSALAMEGLLEPVRDLVTKVMVFLPNLFAATILLVVTVFIARIVRDLVKNALNAAGVDKLSERLGISKAFGEKHLSEVVGVLVFIVILVPSVISALETLQLYAVSEPAAKMLEIILAAVPALISATVLLIVAYAIGKFAAGVVTNVLSGIGVDKFMHNLGLVSESAQQEGRVAKGLGSVFLTGVLLFASIEAANLLGFNQVSVLLMSFIQLAGRILMALLIVLIGVYFAKLAEGLIAHRSGPSNNILTSAVKGAIIVLTLAMALRHLGLANEIINMAFGLLLGSLAVAVALSLGLGTRDIAAREVDAWIRSIKEHNK